MFLIAPLWILFNICALGCLENRAWWGQTIFSIGLRSTDFKLFFTITPWRILGASGNVLKSCCRCEEDCLVTFCPRLCFRGERECIKNTLYSYCPPKPLTSCIKNPLYSSCLPRVLGGGVDRFEF